MPDFVEQLAENEDTIFEIIGRDGVLFLAVSEGFVDKILGKNGGINVDNETGELFEPVNNVDKVSTSSRQDEYIEARKRVGELRRKAKGQFDYLDEEDMAELNGLLKEFNLK